ncbi:NAD(P)/FAD-dependent oxidoreductase [Actinopolyspora erythraea]|uniref:NAD(P)/FAD-dependent oxidoreductase n=1 Tax=Actinopolyspora erythraea TaxID=414996 RepID=A0A223RV13_9ACTN|nr:ArsO family NAD(P)H-dependent flavin-containing monooxygenase [Actinopolyspora erythraea]ASU79710.1 NAD(P)/FAD-dependent oxidoreductase [Actinopolyspora erythraea]
MPETPRERVDVLVIGGGQAGLAAGYFLRRAAADFVVLDEQRQGGGSWQHMWPSLRLFSPARHNSLPGRGMPPQPGAEFPTVDHTIDYLRDYEHRYELPVLRPVRVTGVYGSGEEFTVTTNAGTWTAGAVLSATGTWRAPYVPAYPGMAEFGGTQWHTASYPGTTPFRRQRVLVVGGGNSAAQILAELSTVAETTWVTRRPPRFMPDDVDGRVLFDVATRRLSGATNGVSELGDIVMVDSVRDARERGVLRAHPMISGLTGRGAVWEDGTEREFDSVVWCTGFRPALRHLGPLRLGRERGRIPTEGTRSLAEPRVHLVGYGDWTGPASATLIGAGRTARVAVSEALGGLERKRPDNLGARTH